jgi:hypothetical protein
MSDDRRISEDWEVVARHGNYAWWQAILAVVLGRGCELYSGRVKCIIKNSRDHEK